MGTVTAEAIKALLKSELDTVDFESGAIENDEILLAMSRALAVSFSDNTIFAASISNGGVGEGTIASVEPIPVLAWNSSPTGTYSATSTSGGVGMARVSFSINVEGGWAITGVGDSVSTDIGDWRPTSDRNTISYEIRFTTSGDTATPSGGSDLTGTWTNLTKNSGLFLSDLVSGSKSTSVTVEIREKADPANTTSTASFTITADGEPISGF